MSWLTDEQLAAYLTDSLEPGDRLALEDQLTAFPRLLERLAVLRAQLAPLEAPSWRLPPPGMSRGRSGFSLQHHALQHLGTDGLRPGEPFDLHISKFDQAERRLVVILCQQAGAWQVVYPTSPDEALYASDLPEEPDGTRVMTLTAGDELGAQRWAIALAAPPAVPDWQADQADRWQGLVEGIQKGDVPVTTIEIEVS